MINYTLDGQFFKLGWTLLDMVYNVNNITQSCFVGFKEGAVGLSNYTTQ